MQLWTDSDLDMVPFRETEAKATEVPPRTDMGEATIMERDGMTLQAIRWPDGRLHLLLHAGAANRAAFSLLLTADEAANLAAQIIRTMRRETRKSA